ncbi:hypothetical protein NDU88_001836 [Pleurodeles waltl]|uniref:Uncharacterized protein n=1 Tax=Pleurodeles waltl TaxID=8319 RepID=A0AAV7KZM6_PLEWA|nr:hypothetical protein NDU88_001836 [Pleurodeles waltl]
MEAPIEGVREARHLAPLWGCAAQGRSERGGDRLGCCGHLSGPTEAAAYRGRSGLGPRWSPSTCKRSKKEVRAGGPARRQPSTLACPQGPGGKGSQALDYPEKRGSPQE